MTFTIAVAGPTGAGKSTLCGALVEQFESASAIWEPTPARIARSVATLGWRATQLGILQYRVSALQASRSDITLLDRSPSEDIEIFWQLHFRLGNLSAAEIEELEGQAQELHARSLQPAAAIYVEATPPDLLHRMTAAKQPEWLMNTLHQQLDLYRKWLGRQKADVLRLDTSKESPEESTRQATAWIASRLPRS